MATRIKNKIKVAIDTSTVIDLFTLIHPKHDIDGKVMKSLQEGSLRPEDWENVPKEDLPKLLQDRALGHITNGRYYRLENVYTLLQLVLSKKVEIYITPSTFFRLTGLNDMEFDFLQDYITNLSIRKEDAEELYDIIFALAGEYVIAEQKVNPEYRVFENNFNKACIVAEAAICGFPLITNDMKLVHFTKSGYEMTEMIKEVNRNFSKANLGIKSKKENIITPTTMSLSSFLKSLEDERYYLYPNNKNLRTNREDNTMMLK